MATDITTYAPAVIALPEGLPDIITDTGEKTAWRFIESFTATIRNPNTREAYARAVSRFLAWCEGKGLYDLHAIKPTIVAAYIEQLPGSKPTVKQHLAAIRQCFDWLNQSARDSYSKLLMKIAWYQKNRGHRVCPSVPMFCTLI